MENRLYLDADSDELSNMEKKYNFFPSGMESVGVGASMDKICLGTTKDIAKLRQKGAATEGLEKLLRQSREYAVEKKSSR